MYDFLYFFFSYYQNKGLTIANPDLICRMYIFSYSDSVCMVKRTPHMRKGIFVGFERRDGPLTVVSIHEAKVIQYVRTCDPEPYNITVF